MRARLRSLLLVAAALAPWIGILLALQAAAPIVKAQGWLNEHLFSLALDVATPLVVRIVSVALLVSVAALILARRSPMRSLSALAAAPPVLLAICFAVGQWTLERARTTKLADRPNILLLVIDALRADHLSAYGYDLPTSPGIDALAARGARFSNVMSASNRTRSSMPSMLTGLLPFHHGVFGRDDALDLGYTTVAERLADAGYQTAAFVANPMLDPVFGTAQGFTTYAHQPRSVRDRGEFLDAAAHESATSLRDSFVSWLDRERAEERPFFAWLHYWDVHGPYVPPAPYDKIFSPRDQRQLTLLERQNMGAQLRLPNDGNNLYEYMRRYDGGIRYTDGRITELMRAIDQRGLAQNTMVILTSDHGEAFLEHGFWDHGETMHEEQLHVPLIVVGPGVRPQVVDRLVSSVDIAATILALAGVEARELDGESLVSLLQGRGSDYYRTVALSASLSESLMSRAGKQWAIREGRLKFIKDDTKGTWLYDLNDDPGEQDSVLEAQSDLAEALAKSLGQTASEAEPVRGGAERAGVGGELDERLRALGYVQ